MKRQTFLIGCILFLFVQSCKEEDVQQPLELSQEMKDFFVNYDVGTKWIYQDTSDENNFDTIELVSIENYNVGFAESDVLQSKGFVLKFKQKKSRDFKLQVSPGANNSCYAKVILKEWSDQFSFEHYNGTWTHLVNYCDSIEIKNNKYYKVIESKSSNSSHMFIKISKNTGIVFFVNTWDFHGYTLIKVEKP